MKNTGKLIAIISAAVAAVSLFMPYLGLKMLDYSESLIELTSDESQYLLVIAIAGIALVLIGAITQKKALVFVGAAVMVLFIILFYIESRETLSSGAEFKSGFYIFIVATVGTFIGAGQG